jgi:hypothetical protein
MKILVLPPFPSLHADLKRMFNREFRSIQPGTFLGGLSASVIINLCHPSHFPSESERKMYVLWVEENLKLKLMPGGEYIDFSPHIAI